ncbi:MAG: secretion system protein E, partial [Euryarchaeota archaeon]|nr:secretion system protein E [Euryarchaeota archaeon]
MTEAIKPEQLPEESPAVKEETETRKGRLSSGYLSFLLRIKDKPMKVRIPIGITKGPLDVVTDIPKIADVNVDEVEISKITDPCSFVRIKYDNVGGEYLYEVIEPDLSEDERNLIEVLKSALIMTLNLADVESKKEKEEVLRKATDALVKTFGVSLHPISRERIHYYLKRDFIGYGVID